MVRRDTNNRGMISGAVVRESDQGQSFVHIHVGKQNDTFVKRIPLLLAAVYISFGVRRRTNGARVP